MADKYILLRAPADALQMPVSLDWSFKPSPTLFGTAMQRLGGVAFPRAMNRIVTVVGDLGDAISRASEALTAMGGPLAVAVARHRAMVTAMGFESHAERLSQHMRRGGRLLAKDIRSVARTYGTSDHYGDLDGPGIPIVDFIEAAKLCDEPFDGGDFGCWLFEGIDV